jgi:hypothetical protein
MKKLIAMLAIKWMQCTGEAYKSSPSIYYATENWKDIQEICCPLVL